MIFESRNFLIEIKESERIGVGRHTTVPLILKFDDKPSVGTMDDHTYLRVFLHALDNSLLIEPTVIGMENLERNLENYYQEWQRIQSPPDMLGLYPMNLGDTFDDFYLISGMLTPDIFLCSWKLREMTCFNYPQYSTNIYYAVTNVDNIRRVTSKIDRWLEKES